jgi:hypothetical protein
LAALKISKKSSKYKYPNYAHDEITCDISAKQVEYVCKTKILNSGATETQAEVSRILFRMNKNKYRPLPHEISLMRKAYEEIQNGVAENPEDALDPEVLRLCNKISEGKQSGAIKPDHFALKIVDYARRTGKCSPKQFGVLKSAEAEMDRAVISSVKNSVKAKTDDKAFDNMNELFAMSEALGSGDLGV